MKILLFICAFCLNSFAFSQTLPACTSLRNSTLKYLDADDSTAYVIIDGNKHIEYHKNKKYFIKSDIEWLNDCEWEMTMTEVTIPRFPFGAGDKMHVKVDKIEGDIIFYTATVKSTSWPGRFRKMK